MKEIDKNSVLFLCQFFYPEKVSSATLPFDTASFLVRNGIKVGCLCGFPNEYLIGENQNVKTRETIDGIDINRVSYRTLSRKSVVGRLINYFSFTFKALMRISIAKNYEYIFVYSNPPILPYVAYRAHKKYGTKIVFICYDVYPEIAIQTKSISSGGFVDRLMRNINKKVFDNVIKVVALSDDMKQFLLNSRNVDENKIEIIPNWYENKTYTSAVSNGIFTVSYLGNIGTCQDIDTLLECANILSQNKNIKFVIGGHGNKIQHVKDFVENNHLKNVEIVSFLTGDEYENQMKTSNCFVVSLETGLTGLCFPSKYYSYLAFGRPIIAVMEDNQLTKEIESENIGFKVNNGDSEKLASTIKQLSELNTEAMCRASYAVFETKYTKESCNVRYLNLLFNN